MKWHVAYILVFFFFVVWMIVQSETKYKDISAHNAVDGKSSASHLGGLEQ